MQSGRLFANEARNGRIVRNYCRDIRISPVTWKFKNNETKSGKKIIGFNVNIKEQLKTLRDKIKKHSDIKGNKIRFTKCRKKKSKHRLAA